MVNLIATGNLGWLNVLSTKLQSSWRRSLIVMQSPLDKCKKLRAVSTCGAMYCQLIPYIGRVHNKSMLIHVKLLSGDKRLSRSETNVTPLNCWILHDFADWLVHERKSCACVKLFLKYSQCRPVISNCFRYRIAHAAFQLVSRKNIRNLRVP